MAAVTLRLVSLASGKTAPEPPRSHAMGSGVADTYSADGPRLRSRTGDVEAILDRFHPSVLSAETDAEAVGFYRSCGFTVRSLGEKYPGTERFLCERRPN